MPRSVKHGGKKRFQYRHRNSVTKNKNRSLKKKYSKPEGQIPKSVVKQVEQFVNEQPTKSKNQLKRELKHKLLQQDIEFCEYMMKKYGEDYDAMARDTKNIYQNTAKQIERKIKVYQRSKEREEKMET